jgi:hypothetical protein
VTSINPPRDDLGTLDLKLKNLTSEAITPVTQVQPAPAVRETQTPAQLRERQPRQQASRKQGRKKERRQKERRKRQEPVLLDTRSHRDRRQHERRASGRNATTNKTTNAQHSQKKGFDDFA